MDSSLWIDIVLAAESADAPVVNAADPLIVEKELIHVGTFSKHTNDGEVKYNITSKLLDHWHKTFAEMSKDNVEVPMPLGHSRNPELKRGSLVGTIRKPNSKGVDSLFGQVKYKDAKAKENLSASQVSIFVPKKSGKYTMPIEHVAFTDYPVVTTLEPFNIVASVIEEDDMTLRELANIAGVDPALTDEQQIMMALAQKLQAIPKPPVPGQPPVGAPPVPPRAPMPGRFSNDPVKDNPEPLTGALMDVVKENRQLRLSRLSEGKDARITPAQRKILEEKYLTEESLSFSHVDGGNEDFNTVVQMIEAGAPIRDMKKTGAQALVLSKDDQANGEKNPLVRGAEKRAKEAAHN